MNLWATQFSLHFTQMADHLSPNRSSITKHMPTFINLIIKKRGRFTVDVACMDEKKNAYKTRVRKHEIREDFVKPTSTWKHNLRLHSSVKACGMKSFGSGYCPLAAIVWTPLGHLNVLRWAAGSQWVLNWIGCDVSSYNKTNYMH